MLYDSDQLRLQRLMAFEEGKSQAIVMRTEPGTPLEKFPTPSGPLAQKTGELFLRGDDGYYAWAIDETSGIGSWEVLPDAAVARTLGGTL